MENKKLGVLFSTGKDSTYAMHKMKDSGYEITCLICIRSKNKDSYMFHTAAIELAKQQAEAIGLPLIIWETEGKEEEELKDLKDALWKAKLEYGINGIVTGALYSNYQKERIEKICEELELETYSPLWHKDQEQYMRELIDYGIKFILTKVSCEGLDKTWLNKIINNDDVDKLVKIDERIGINISGEGGEFESLVLDAPMFKKKLEIAESEIAESSENCAEMIIKEVKLIKK